MRAITYKQDMIVMGGSIAYPLYRQAQYEVAWFGANFGVDTGIPEPGTWATLAAGLVALGVLMRRRTA